MKGPSCVPCTVVPKQVDVECYSAFLLTPCDFLPILSFLSPNPSQRGQGELNML